MKPTPAEDYPDSMFIISGLVICALLLVAVEGFAVRNQKLDAEGRELSKPFIGRSRWLKSNINVMTIVTNGPTNTDLVITNFVIIVKTAKTTNL